MTTQTQERNETAVATAEDRTLRTQDARQAVPAPARYRHATPLVDVYETEDGLTLVADIPGVSKETLEVSVKEGILTLDAKAEAPEFEGGTWLWREHLPTHFHREFRISETIDVSKIAAELKNGTLRLSLPKAEEAKPRRIEVKVS
jgi:HSP20 family molecular chaperone IbpA